jgi:hypothetical protein
MKSRISFVRSRAGSIPEILLLVLGTLAAAPAGKVSPASFQPEKRHL